MIFNRLPTILCKNIRRTIQFKRSRTPRVLNAPTSEEQFYFRSTKMLQSDNSRSFLFENIKNTLIGQRNKIEG